MEEGEAKAALGCSLLEVGVGLSGMKLLLSLTSNAGVAPPCGCPITDLSQAKWQGGGPQEGVWLSVTKASPLAP